jgi:integrase
VVRWRDEAKAQRKRSFKRKLDADRYRAQLEHELSTGAYVDPGAGRVPFHDYAEVWRRAQPVRATTAVRHRVSLELHAYPALGDRPIAAIRPSEIQAFVTGLSQRLAPATVRTVYATVRAVFRAAARDRVIQSDPCQSKAVSLPAGEHRRIVPLSVDQVAAIAAGMPAQLQALVITGAGTGLRRGELLGLQLTDVDFLRRQVQVERQRQRSTGGGLAVVALKNRRAYRSVPVGQTVTTALAEHCRRFPPGEFVFPIGSVEGLFAVWSRARTAAGVPWATPHDLRHFYASCLIAAGLSVKVVSARLGHANAAMTLNTYAHLWGDDDDRSRHAVDAAFIAKINQRAPSVRPAQGV